MYYNIPKFNGYTIDDSRVVRDSNGKELKVVPNKLGVPSVSLKMRNGFSVLMPIDDLYNRRAEEEVKTPISDSNKLSDADMAEFLRQEHEIWEPLGGHKNEVVKLDDGVVEHDVEGKVTRMNMNTWYDLKNNGLLDGYIAKYGSPRIIPDILAGNAETWIAPVGGCDYVLTENGRRINMKHLPTDNRYNEEFDGKPCGLSACKYLDLNDINLEV